jgi:Tfp pilus assembly pilus retraction ATPase PilT
MTILEIYSAILDIAQEKKYSDVHINTGSFPILRDSSGDIVTVKTLTIQDAEIQLKILSNQEVLEIIKHVL